MPLVLHAGRSPSTTSVRPPSDVALRSGGVPSVAPRRPRPLRVAARAVLSSARCSVVPASVRAPAACRSRRGQSIALVPLIVVPSPDVGRRRLPCRLRLLAVPVVSSSARRGVLACRVPSVVLAATDEDRSSRRPSPDVGFAAPLTSSRSLLVLVVRAHVAARRRRLGRWSALVRWAVGVLRVSCAVGCWRACAPRRRRSGVPSSRLPGPPASPVCRRRRPPRRRPAARAGRVGPVGGRRGARHRRTAGGARRRSCAPSLSRERAAPGTRASPRRRAIAAPPSRRARGRPAPRPVAGSRRGGRAAARGRRRAGGRRLARWLRHLGSLALAAGRGGDAGGL